MKRKLPFLKFLLFFLIFLAISLNISAQKVTLSIKNQPLESVLNSIRQQTGLSLVFSEQVVDLNRIVSIEASNEKVEVVLKQLLASSNVGFEIKDKKLYLVEKPKKSTVKQTNLRTISGTITDTKGAPIIGATIIVNGSNGLATITNLDGFYKLENAPANALISISSIGFESITVPIEKAERIIMKEDEVLLEEVVVIGYGTMKKVNLTGSVSAINMSEVTEGRPVTNLSRGLSGLAAGVHISSTSNRPSNDDATIRIRGQGTLNNSSPLVIVDGVESDISNVNPEDIDNISILKDAASSAIYGSRAANGVILITTKKGTQGKIKLNYNGYLSHQSVYDRIEPVSNYADYMELVNEGLANSYQPKPFSAGNISKWRQMEGIDPIGYANNDWRKEVFKASLSQTHSASLSGGNEIIRFFSSFRYMNNTGVIENAGIQRYDFRTNVEAKLNEWMFFGTNINGTSTNVELGSNLLGDVFTYAQASTPGFVYRAPDGRYGGISNLEDNIQSNNILRILNSIDGDEKHLRGSTQFYTILKPFTGLTINSSFSLESKFLNRWQKPIFHDRWNLQNNTILEIGKGRTHITNFALKRSRYFMDISGTFEKKIFNKLVFQVIAGASQEQFLQEQFETQKFDLTDLSLGVINAAIGDASSSGSKIEWAMRSYFSRLNLNWADKYLFEMNLRADGSSRFLSGNRWGYFPSVSAGWRIDQESYMHDLRSKGLTNLKLRGSYGSLGNNSVGNYEAISVYSQSNYILNDGIQLGMAINSISNAILTWEKTYVTNLGVDIGLFNNRLTSTFDLFNKKTVDILIDLPAPLVRGQATVPRQNSATVINNGLELTVNWRDKIKNFKYFISGNVSFIKNKVTKFKGEEYSIIGNGLIKEGLPIGAQFLLTADRIVSNQQDLLYIQKMIDDAPVDPISGNKRNPFAAYGRPELGDILYKDTDQNGIIDDNDRSVFGFNGTNPPLMYGFTFNFEYRNFDFSTLLQGIAGLKLFYSDNYFRPIVRLGYQINKEIAEGRWYEGRETPAKYPRLLNSTDSRNIQPSSFWLTDKSFMRVKNIQIGYTLPKKTLSRFEMDRVRFYISLENFLTFTTYPGIDPEVSNTNYPPMREAVLGLNVTL